MNNRLCLSLSVCLSLCLSDSVSLLEIHETIVSDPSLMMRKKNYRTSGFHHLVHKTKAKVRGNELNDDDYFSSLKAKICFSSELIIAFGVR